MSILSKKITIRSVYGKVDRIIVNPVKDPVTKRFPPHVRPVDSHGDMILSEADKSSNEVLIPENYMIELKDGTEFDMSNPVDKAKWEAIKHCSFITPERFSKDSKGDLLIDGGKTSYGKAFLYVHVQEEEVRKDLNKKKDVHKAISLAISNNYLDNEKVARILGCSTNGMTSDELELWLISQAENNPSKILQLYSSGDIKVRILFIDAVEKGYIVNQHGLYKYDGNILGSTEGMVVDWLKNPQNEEYVNQLYDLVHPELAVSKVKEIKDEAISQMNENGEIPLIANRKTRK